MRTPLIFGLLMVMIAAGLVITSAPSALDYPVMHYGETVDGYASVSIYQFEGKAGDQISLEVSAANPGCDMNLYLMDASSHTLTSAILSPGHVGVSLSHTLDRGGSYHIRVSELELCDYALRLSAVTPISTITLRR